MHLKRFKLKVIHAATKGFSVVGALRLEMETHSMGQHMSGAIE